jgi:hypothetical protein
MYRIRPNTPCRQMPTTTGRILAQRTRCREPRCSARRACLFARPLHSERWNGPTWTAWTIWKRRETNKRAVSTGPYASAWRTRTNSIGPAIPGVPVPVGHLRRRWLRGVHRTTRSLSQVRRTWPTKPLTLHRTLTKHGIGLAGSADWAINARFWARFRLPCRLAQAGLLFSSHKKRIGPRAAALGVFNFQIGVGPVRRDLLSRFCQRCAVKRPKLSPL